jgi:hypothetical protein
MLQVRCHRFRASTFLGGHLAGTDPARRSGAFIDPPAANLAP